MEHLATGIKELEPFRFFDPDALEGSIEFIHLGDLLLRETGRGLGTVQTRGRASRLRFLRGHDHI